MSFQRGNQTSLKHGGEEMTTSTEGKASKEKIICQLENHPLHFGKIVYLLRLRSQKKKERHILQLQRIQDLIFQRVEE